MNSNLLQERRERVDQSERFTAITICWTTAQSFIGVLFIESKPYPRDQPPKLNDNEWTLKPDYAHHA